MTVLSGSQFEEWRAYDELEPVGGYRQDYRFAQVCSLIFNIAQAAYGDENKITKSNVFDFMPWGPERKIKIETQSIEEMKAIMLALAKSKKDKKSGSR